MTRHPRSLIVARATTEFETSWMAICEKHGLTDVEQLQVLVGEMASNLKYCLRAERHPDDPSRPADFE